MRSVFLEDLRTVTVLTGSDKDIRVYDASCISMSVWGSQKARHNPGCFDNELTTIEYLKALGHDTVSDWSNLRETAKASALSRRELSDDGAPRLWHVFQRGHAGVIPCCVFGTDCRTLVTCSQDGTVREWDCLNKVPIRKLMQPSPTFSAADTVSSCAISPDCALIVSASWDGTVKLFRRGRPVHVLKGHKGKLACVRLTPDGRTVISCGADGVVRLWGTESGEAAGVLRGRMEEVVRCITQLAGIFEGQGLNRKQSIVASVRTPGAVEGLGDVELLVDELCTRIDSLKEDGDAQAEGRTLISTSEGQMGDRGGEGVGGGLPSASFEPDGGVFESCVCISLKCPAADCEVCFLHVAFLRTCDCIFLN